MQTYKRPRIVLKEGKGATVKDSFGKEYIDCVGGITGKHTGFWKDALFSWNYYIRDV